MKKISYLILQKAIFKFRNSTTNILCHFLGLNKVWTKGKNAGRRVLSSPKAGTILALRHRPTKPHGTLHEE